MVGSVSVVSVVNAPNQLPVKVFAIEQSENPKTNMSRMYNKKDNFLYYSDFQINPLTAFRMTWIGTSYCIVDIFFVLIDNPIR